jgi:hypothetical protein
MIFGGYARAENRPLFRPRTALVPDPPSIHDTLNWTIAHIGKAHARHIDSSKKRFLLAVCFLTLSIPYPPSSHRTIPLFPRTQDCRLVQVKQQTFGILRSDRSESRGLTGRVVDE